MKYTQYSQNKKGNSAFYITIAMCLVLIGVAAWFALTGVDKKDIDKISSDYSRPITSSEYNSSNPSYIESRPDTSSIIFLANSPFITRFGFFSPNIILIYLIYI